MIVSCTSCAAAVNVGGGDCCPRCGDLVDLYGDARPAWHPRDADPDTPDPQKVRK